MNYFPHTLPFLFGLFLLFAIVVFIIELHIVQYTYERVGVSPRFMLALLLLSFLGSYINIDVAQLPPERMYAPGIVQFFGVPYVVPVVTESPGTIIAVNVGGAIVPTLLSLYLIVKNRFYGRALVAICLVTIIVHLLAYPVPGVGIGEPIFVPPLATAIVALAISRERTAPLAYVAGSLGTLIGADLLNLDKVAGLGAPIASIGGAGKFDGIFLNALIAVLLAGLLAPKRGPWGSTKKG
ncbi:MAG TPA: DUF1614 domain-containing protein [Candidatus Methylomirabilis sp.]|nr:DUF1614 domain-containing protein [Candidatus Methylomirabilis sp.]